MVDLVQSVASSFPTDRKSFDSVIMISNSVTKIRQIHEVIPSGIGTTILTSKSRVIESFADDDIAVVMMDESLSTMGLQILNQLHDMILQAIGEGRIARGENLSCTCRTSGWDYSQLTLRCLMQTDSLHYQQK